MKRLQKLSEEIVPLSRKQALVLMIIIACIFQFVFFYAPALADEAVSRQIAAGEKEWQLTGQLETLAAREEAALKEREKLTTEATELIITNDSVIKSAFMDPEAAKLAIKAEAASYEVIRTSRHFMTAYNSEAAQTDDSPCITANGFNVCEHGIEDTIAANFLKFGTKVQIPELFGDRVFVVRDRMNKRYSDRVDIWMKEKGDAIQFGVKVAEIKVIVMEEEKIPTREIAKK